MAYDTHPAYYLSNMLHPGYVGKDLSDEERYFSNEFLENYSSILNIWDENKDSIAETFQQYLGKTGLMVKKLFVHSLLN